MTGRVGTPETWRGVQPRLATNPRLAVVAVILVGVAYYVGARVGLSLSLVERNVTPLWPPTGIALAAFLVLGRPMWPGVALAAFAVNLPISSGPLAAAVTAVGNTLAPLVAALLLERVGFRRQLDRQRDALAIVFLAALASMSISATIGSTTLAASGTITAGELPGAWVVWWTGDAMGVLAVAPFLLCLPLFWELVRWTRARWLEAVTILVVTAAVVTWTAVFDLDLLFVALPLLGWAAWRLQLRGAAPAALIASLIATWSATHELGGFGDGTLSEQMLTLQAFNACVALTSFFLAALVTERSQSAQAQLSVEEARARREHEIAETLQRSLLPDRIPDIPGVALAARYVPATSDMRVGGDWYDVVQLDDGLIGLAIGDVAGHGPQAAATMGQLRMALRAYAVENPSPVAVLNGVHRLVAQLPMPEMVTLLYLVFDPDGGTLRFTNAGHPPPLVVGNGRTGFLDGGLAPPLGVTSEPAYTEELQTLPPGATLLLYTDGLVERRTASIQDGLDRLLREAQRHKTAEVGALCDHLLTALSADATIADADDIALVALRPLLLVGAPLLLTVPAEPRVLVDVRQALRRWLMQAAIGESDANEILLAGGEACANVVRHAYHVVPGTLEVEARLVDDAVELTVRDHGEWRPPADRGGGWGYELMEGLMDSVEVHRGPHGTEVQMRRRARTGGRG